jgi:hypothetical protein
VDPLRRTACGFWVASEKGGVQANAIGEAKISNSDRLEVHPTVVDDTHFFGAELVTGKNHIHHIYIVGSLEGGKEEVIYFEGAMNPTRRKSHSIRS